MPNDDHLTQTKLLDRYLNGELSGEQLLQLEQSLKNDENLRHELDILLLSRDKTNTQALNHEKELYQQDTNDVKPKCKRSANIKTMLLPKLIFQWLLRVVGILCIALLGYGAFQFVNVNPDRIYDHQFIDYNLPISNVQAEMTILDSLYLEKNYQGVIGSFQSQEEQSERDYFLAAISYMQSEQYEQAILLFMQLQQADQFSSSEQEFDEETEYYLALAYLKAGQIDNAIPLFEKINQQPRHLFHPYVSQLTLWKLKLLEMKQ